MINFIKRKLLGSHSQTTEITPFDTDLDSSEWELNNANDAKDDFSNQLPDEDLFKVKTLPKVINRLIRSLTYQSFKGREEWIKYYRGRYNRYSPDPTKFKQLIERYGFWYICSPHFSGSEEGANFCFNGITLADIDFLIKRYYQVVLEEKKDFFAINDKNQIVEDNQNPYISINNTLNKENEEKIDTDSIKNHLIMQNRANDVQDNKITLLALECLTILFLEKPLMWMWITDFLHKDNRVIITQLIYEINSPKTRQNLLSSWEKGHWLSKNALNAIAKRFS